MAKKDKLSAEETVTTNIDDISGELIKSLNREFGHRLAYNLAVDEAPTNVKRWLSTGSRQLDYMIRNAAGGGFPEGRIIEVSGVPSSGKSHIAIAASVLVQRRSGIVVYIDSECATSIDLLKKMGLDVSKRFVYCETSCTEQVFAIAESTIKKAKMLNKDVPILLIWDSVAATSPKAELDGEYEAQSMGLQARTISKCLRKITGVIGENNVTFLCLNQLRSGIGILHGDPMVTPGGAAIPFHASVRVRLGSANLIKDESTGNAIGSHVTVTLKKNKLAPNGRKCEFDIIFGKGIVEDQYIFDTVRANCALLGPLVVNDESMIIEGAGAWKTLTVKDVKTDTVKIEKKFYKADFGTDIMNATEYKKYVDLLVDRAYVQPLETANISSDVNEDEILSDIEKAE